MKLAIIRSGIMQAFIAVFLIVAASAMVRTGDLGATSTTQLPNTWICSIGDASCPGASQTINPMPSPRSRLSAVTGTDGQIYTIGGSTTDTNPSGFGNSNAVPLLEVYNPGSNSWMCSAGDINSGCTSNGLAPMPTARNRFGSALGPTGLIYTFGGSNGDVSTDVVEVYDPVQNSWICSIGDASCPGASQTINPMPMRRSRFGTATSPDGSTIYVIGGFDGHNYVSTVEAYDTHAKAWACSTGDLNPGCASTTLAPMPTARGELASLTGPDGLIYATGGWAGTVYPSNYVVYNTVEVYNTMTNSWTTSAPLVTPRQGHAMALGRDGAIYVIGGYGPAAPPNGRAIGSVESFRPNSKFWTPAPDMPTPRTRLAAVTGFDGRIFAIGGIRSAAILGTVEAYLPPMIQFLPLIRR